jgi:hypothetical protein
MPVVPGVLLDHVLIDPAQADWLAVVGNEIVQATARRRLAGSLDGGVVGREISVRAGRIDVIETRLRTVLRVIEEFFRLVVEIVEPGLDFGHVPDEAEQRHSRRLAGPDDELLRTQPRAFQQQRGTVVIKPGFERIPLTAYIWSLGALRHRPPGLG